MIEEMTPQVLASLMVVVLVCAPFITGRVCKKWQIRGFTLCASSLRVVAASDYWTMSKNIARCRCMTPAAEMLTVKIPCTLIRPEGQEFDPCVTDTLSLDHSGRYLFTGSREGRVRYWSTQDERLLWQRDAPGFVMSSSVSPTAEWVASGHTDGKARVRSVDDSSLLRELTHPHDVKDLAFSPDGQYPATACSDGLARVWNLRCGSVERHLQHRYLISEPWCRVSQRLHHLSAQRGWCYSSFASSETVQGTCACVRGFGSPAACVHAGSARG